jgi:taurine transport system permease protein
LPWQVDYVAPAEDAAAGPDTSAADDRRPALAPAPAAARPRRVVPSFVPSTVLILAVLLFWQFGITHGIIPGVPAQYLGSPSGVIRQFGYLAAHGYTGTPLWQHFLASVLRTLAGVLLATLVGVPFGIAMGLSRLFDRTFGPVIGFLRPIPALAFIPVVVLWLGIGETSKVFVIFMSSLLFVATGAALGVRAVPGDYYFVARNYGLRGWKLIWHIVLPPALPQLIAGLRTALTVGWAVVVAAELIGASEGLGYMIRNASEVFDVDTAYVGILLIGIVGVAFEYGFRYLERRLLHWQVAR